MNRLNKLVQGIAFVSIVTFAGTVYASPDGKVDMTQCPIVEVDVHDIASASGWGAHFSTTANTDGFGGNYVECHLTPSGSSVVALCYDGYQDSANHQNKFQLELGLRANIRGVTFTVGERGVNVVTTRVSTSPYTLEMIPYTASAFFPLRVATGFCSQPRLYWKEDGVLNARPGRGGSGYQVTINTL